jgi:ABC-type Zn uptake system ZnuABC Zn-binding protein ZnuA
MQSTLAGLIVLLTLPAPARVLKVVTTLPDYASIVKEVGKDRVEVTSIVVGARDPHRIEAKPSFMSRAASADLWVANGLDLEIAYEHAIIEGSRNTRIRPGTKGHAYVGDWVKVIDRPAGAVTRAQGDIHPYGNPHVWLDPYNGRVIASKLGEVLGDLEPANAAFFKANAQGFVSRLDAAMFGQACVDKIGGANLWQWDSENQLIPNLKERSAEQLLGGWAARMRPFWKQPIVTYHRSWVYFAFRFGLRVVAELEPKPGIEPTPGHVANVIKIIQQTGARAILQERFYSTRNGKFVEARTGATLVVVPGSVSHEPAASDYIALIDTLVNRVADAMRR